MTVGLVGASAPPAQAAVGPVCGTLKTFNIVDFRSCVGISTANNAYATTEAITTDTRYYPYDTLNIAQLRFGSTQTLKKDQACGQFYDMIYSCTAAWPAGTYTGGWYARGAVRWGGFCDRNYNPNYCTYTSTYNQSDPGTVSTSGPIYP